MNGATYWRHAEPADFAVLGDPVGHSWSPAMHRAAYAARGLDLRYTALQVPREELPEALEALTELGYRGVNCTVPLKEDAFAWAERIDEASRAYGALNTLRLTDRAGTNTDAPGLLDTFADLAVPQGAAVLLLGAGGTARAVVLALHRAGFAVRVANRTRANAERMIASLDLDVPILDAPDLAGVNVVINATSAGLSGEAWPLDWSRSHPDVLAYDLLYAREPTPFVADAARAGRRTVDGRALLAAQGARSFSWWLGGEPPRVEMRAALP